MHIYKTILESKKRQIEASLTSMFDDVREAIDAAARCLFKRDQGTCLDLIDNDAVINEKRRLIEQDCMVAIASQQPVAHDLRDIVSDMRIASELERMGDYARDIAACILEMDDTSLEDLGLLDIQTMAGVCQQMLSQVLRARRDNDPTLARSLAASDDRLDASLRRVAQALLHTMREHPEKVQNGSRMLWIAHNLERCGDRLTNIAEQVVFRVEGTLVDLG